MNYEAQTKLHFSRLENEHEGSIRVAKKISESVHNFIRRNVTYCVTLAYKPQSFPFFRFIKYAIGIHQMPRYNGMGNT